VLVLKVAVTVVLAVRVKVQVVVALVHPPLNPAETEPGAAVAVRVTDVPEAKEPEQVAPQLIPAGEEVTVPVPVPDFVRVSVGLPEPVLMLLTVIGMDELAVVSFPNWP
jgi:hypothetical protein